MTNGSTSCGTECYLQAVLTLLVGSQPEKIVSLYPRRKPVIQVLPTDQPIPPACGKPKQPILTTKKEDEHSFDAVPTEFGMTLAMLAHAFKCQDIACNDAFDLKLNGQRYVGWPKSWRPRISSSGTVANQISIVFALKPGCDDQTAAAYQTLSNKIGVSLVMLQNYFGFLEREEQFADKVYTDTVPKAGDSSKMEKDPLNEFAKVSFLVQPLIDMFDEVKARGSIHKYLINFVELGFCDEAHSLSRLNVVPKGRQEIDEIVRRMKPYHGILLLEDIWPTPDANPIVANLLMHCSPDRSILDMSTASGIPIFEVFMIIRHLLQWTRAILIYPLCNTNVYTSATSPQPLEKMAEKFAAQFGTKIHLAAGLAHFNPPRRLDTFIRKNLPLEEQSVRAKLVVALLRHQMLMQLHEFYYILKPYSNAKMPQPKEKCPEELEKMIEDSEIPKDCKEIVADICAEMLDKIAYVDVKKKLSLFVKAAPMLNGNHHLEDINYKNNLDRAEIEAVFDSFKLVIAKFRRPDFVAE